MSVFPRDRSKALRVLVAAVSLCVLSACTEGYEEDDVRFIAAYLLSGTPPKDYIPPEMQALCENEAGSELAEIYNVRGYAIARRTDLYPIKDTAEGIVGTSGDAGGCFPCLTELVERDFDYIEAPYRSAEDRYQTSLQNGTAVPERYYYDQYATKTGLYRYSLADRSEGNTACAAFDDALRKARVQEGYLFALPKLAILLRDYRRTQDELGDRCVSATRIDAFQARYLVQTEIKRVLEVPWWLLSGHVSKSRDSILDRQRGEIVAQTSIYRYQLHSGGKGFRLWSGCGDAGRRPIEELLHPVRIEGKI
ncbi:hypothetical protein [Pyruvatibacter mobilis]|uniref:hypothetical protein n=1 Tax=Pyruvatibacter mobilis TaxID=1712261 RepID=UPI003D1371B6